MHMFWIKMRDYLHVLMMLVAGGFTIAAYPLAPAVAQNSSPNSNFQNRELRSRPPMFISDALSKDAVFWAWKGNAEVQQCGYCHYQSGNEFASRESELSRFIELKLWLEQDKHAIARQRVEPIATAEQAARLERFRAEVAHESQQKVTIPDYWIGPSNALSAKICQQLGQDVSTEAGYQWFRESCLTCHGGYELTERGLSRDQNSTKKDVANNSPVQSAKADSEFDASNVNRPGISCNYCHQEDPSSTQWIDLHSGLASPEKWRSLSPAQKSTAGMRDLTPVRAQAELCFQCHVGNIDKGMFVTHDMYAAGHPPLPAVELNTLLEKMPRHWQTPQDLMTGRFGKTALARPYFKVNYGVDGDAPVLRELPWDAQAIAVGALVAEKHWIELLVRAESSKHWGDYALYDCAACHHELNNDSQRQKVRAPGSPGRPRLIEWPHPGALAVAASLGDSNFQTTLNQLQAAIKKRPFGDRQAVVQSGQALSKQINSSLDQLTLSRLPANYNSRLLLALCDTPAESLLDYQSARWINWSARGLLKALGDRSKKLPDAEKKIAMLGQAMGPEGGERITVTRNLPATQSQVIFPDFVERELKLQQAYDSAAFTRQLAEIRQALQAAPQP